MGEVGEVTNIYVIYLGGRTPPHTHTHTHSPTHPPDLVINDSSLTSTKFWMCPYNFRKYRTYCELVKFVETTCRIVTQNLYNIAKNGDISRTHERNSAKLLQLTQMFCRIRCTKIRLFKKSKGCNTASAAAWQQNEGRMFILRNLSGVPNFKAIKRICIFDMVVTYVRNWYIREVRGIWS